MLIQSHIIGIVYLLPSIPFDIIPSGFLRGIMTRGSAEVSIHWGNGRLLSAKIVLQQYHPWWKRYNEIFPGFFVPLEASINLIHAGVHNQDDKHAHMSIISPNEIVSPDHGASCYQVSPSTTALDFYHIEPSIFGNTKSFLNVNVFSYPCEIQFCDAKSDMKECANSLIKL